MRVTELMRKFNCSLYQGRLQLISIPRRSKSRFYRFAAGLTWQLLDTLDLKLGTHEWGWTLLNTSYHHLVASLWPPGHSCMAAAKVRLWTMWLILITLEPMLTSSVYPWVFSTDTLGTHTYVAENYRDINSLTRNPHQWLIGDNGSLSLSFPGQTVWGKVSFVTQKILFRTSLSLLALTISVAYSYIIIFTLSWWLSHE